MTKWLTNCLTTSQPYSESVSVFWFKPIEVCKQLQVNSFLLASLTWPFGLLYGRNKQKKVCLAMLKRGRNSRGAATVLGVGICSWSEMEANLIAKSQNSLWAKLVVKLLVHVDYQLSSTTSYVTSRSLRLKWHRRRHRRISSNNWWTDGRTGGSADWLTLAVG